MAATIDNFDIGVYTQYAQRTHAVEQIRQSYHLEEAEKIPPQTQFIAVQPQPSEMDLLLGTIAFITPWALFLPPKRFRKQRRSPFTFSRIAPELGSDEMQEALLEKVMSLPLETEEETQERDMIVACFDRLDKLNEMLGHIIGRIGQFLQG